MDCTLNNNQLLEFVPKHSWNWTHDSGVINLLRTQTHTVTSWYNQCCRLSCLIWGLFSLKAWWLKEQALALVIIRQLVPQLLDIYERRERRERRELARSTHRHRVKPDSRCQDHLCLKSFKVSINKYILIPVHYVRDYKHYQSKKNLLGMKSSTKNNILQTEVLQEEISH